MWHTLRFTHALTNSHNQLLIIMKNHVTKETSMYFLNVAYSSLYTRIKLVQSCALTADQIDDFNDVHILWRKSFATSHLYHLIHLL